MKEGKLFPSEIWSEFEEQLQKLLPAKDEEVFNILKRKYMQTNRKFRKSRHCRMALKNCLELISKHPGRIYVFLNDLKSTFKFQTTIPKEKVSATQQTDSAVKEETEPKFYSVSDREAASPPSPSASSSHSDSCTIVSRSNVGSEGQGHTGEELVNGASENLAGGQSSLLPYPGVGEEEDDDDDVIILVDSPTPPNDLESHGYVGQEEQQQPEASTSSTELGDEDNSKEKKRTNIARLEHLLTRITRTIRQLEEQELDLDELDSTNSAYLQLDVLKRRYLQVWRRLCEARKVARISGRILRRPFCFSSCRYANINIMVEELVNKQKEFPDYSDIHKIVSTVNKQDNLHLSATTVAQLAREVFVDVGHQLKRRRQADLRHDFGSHLTDNLQEEQDPIYSDAVLRRQLVENKHIGEAKLDSVFDKYVRLQYSSTPAEADDQEAGSSTSHSVQQISIRCKAGSTTLKDDAEETTANNCDEETRDCGSPASSPVHSPGDDLITISSESDSDEGETHPAPEPTSSRKRPSPPILLPPPAKQSRLASPSDLAIGESSCPAIPKPVPPLSAAEEDTIDVLDSESEDELPPRVAPATDTVGLRWCGLSSAVIRQGSGTVTTFSAQQFIANGYHRGQSCAASQFVCSRTLMSPGGSPVLDIRLSRSVTLPERAPCFWPPPNVARPFRGRLTPTRVPWVPPPLPLPTPPPTTSSAVGNRRSLLGMSSYPEQQWQQTSDDVVIDLE